MGRYQSVADHKRRQFCEPEDDSARIFYVAKEGEVLATSRSNWGGDAPFAERLIGHYEGDRTFKLASGTTSEHGRYVKSLGDPVTGMGL